MATGGAGNLGGASFTITANTAQFQEGMQQAQQLAQTASGSIETSLGNMQRQLAAINTTAMTTTNAISELTSQLGKMRSISTSAFSGMGGAGASFGGGGMGLLNVAYMLDDIQYGFRSIVNNIPQVGMAVGAAMGLSTQATMAFAGALGVVAVAINQAIQHGDKLAGAFKPVTDVLQNLSTWFEGADVFKKMSDSIANLSDNMETLPAKLKKIRAAIEEIEKTAPEDRNLFQQEKLAGLKNAEKEGKQRIKDEETIANMEDEQVKKNREAAQKAFSQIPGGAEAVRGYLTQEGMNPNEARRMVAGAGRGVGQDLEDILGHITSDVAAQQFAPLFGATPEARRQKEQDEASIKLHEKQQEKVKQETKQRDHLNDVLTKTGKEYESAGKLTTMQQQKTDLEKQFAREKRMLTGDQKRELEDAITGSTMPKKAQIHSSAMAAATAMLTSVQTGRIPEKQLEHLKKMDENLKSIKENIKNVGTYQ